MPNAGVTRVGLVPNTRAPLPVSPVTAAAKLAELGVARNVATPVPKPEIPARGAEVAAIVPVLAVAKLAPAPTTIAAVVFVPEVRALKLVAAVADAFSVPEVMLKFVPRVRGVTVVPPVA